MSIIYHLHFNFHIASMLLALGLVQKQTQNMAEKMYLCAIKYLENNQLQHKYV